VTVSDEPATIDRNKLRAAIRRLSPEYVFYMLDDAIDLLPLAELEGIAKKYLDLKRLRPDSDRQAKPTLLADVKSFNKASRAGEYYESFMVNSGNCTAQSTGTTAWIATYHRLLGRCSLIRHHCDCDRERMLASASEFAAAEQREALARIPDRQASGQSQGRKP
jgi:hypothetical protein